MAFASTPLVGAVAGAVGFVGLLVERSGKFSLFAPYSGWQLYAVEAAVGGALVAVGCVSAVLLARRYRALRGRTPHRRVAILATLLPGLFFGGVAAMPMRAALSWGSDHTAAAAAAREQLARWQADYRKAPPAAPTSFPPATGAVARALLQVADLGPGWYPAMTPSPAGGVVPPQLARAGVTGVGRVTWTEQHWSGRSWSPKLFLIEAAYTFRSSGAAQQYERAESARQDPSCPCETTYSRTATRRVAGVMVREHVTTSSFGAHREAAFVVGSLVVTLLIDVPDGNPTDIGLDALVAKAVTRTLAR